MPRGMKGRGFGRGFAFPGCGYAYGWPAYGTGYGRGFGRGRGIGATLGYWPYTGMPRGWRWYGYGMRQYNQRYSGYPVQPAYGRDGQ